MKQVIIIGTGGIGQRHIRGFLKTGRVELSVVEPHPQRRQQAVEDYSLLHAFADISDVDLKQFDLAVICAPAHVHVLVMKSCIDAELPFLVEKPLSVTLDGVDEVLAEATAKGIDARVGYIRRVGKENQALRQAVLDGVIGPVRLAYINGSHDFPKARPDFQSTYYAKLEMGGGAILDSASHAIDLLIWIMGKAAEVSCMYDTLVLEGTETEDTCLITIRFRSGAMANLVINQFQKRSTNTIELIGGKGNLLLDQSTLKMTDGNSGEWGKEKEYMQKLTPMEMHEARFAMQAEAMLDALEGKVCCLASLEDARENLHIALAAKQSWDEKRVISL